jgi:hypothetical protein
MEAGRREARKQEERKPRHGSREMLDDEKR